VTGPWSAHAEQARTTHQSARHRDHLLLAARQRAGALIEPFGDARKQFQHSRQIFGDGAAVVPDIGAHRQILAHRHQRENTTRLGNRTDAGANDLMRRQSVDRAAIQRDSAGAWRDQTEDDFHRRRFAAGVAAEQANDPSAADFERQIEMRLDGAVKRVDAIKAQQRLAHATGSGCGAAPPMPEWPR
jgi:hypothetical protein